MLDLEDLKVPPPMSDRASLAAGFQEGGSALLILDNCPNEPIWQTDKGPIGSLVCGASYNIFYVPETKSWVAVGPNRTLQLQKAAETMTGAAYIGEPPSARKLVVWGLSVSWRENGQALLDGKTAIGRLVAGTSAAMPVTAPQTTTAPVQSAPARPVEDPPSTAVERESNSESAAPQPPAPARPSWAGDIAKKN